MARYIDADALIDDLCSYAEANKGTYHEEGFKNAITVVEDQPSADVVEVVRCKDCKWYEETDARIGTCLLVERGAEINGFCAWGERRDDG